MICRWAPTLTDKERPLEWGTRGRFQLRVDAADLDGFGDAADAEDVGGNARRHVAVEMNLRNVVEGGLHDALQAVVDILRFPEKVRFVLHPFEVGDGDASGVAEDIGNDEGAFALEDA